MAAALESKFVSVEGVKLHYQELGSGAPLICMHGAGPGASAESNFKLNAGPAAKPETAAIARAESNCHSAHNRSVGSPRCNGLVVRP